MGYIIETGTILEFMGFQFGVDYVTTTLDDGTVGVEWFSAQPQPTEAEVAANVVPWLRSVATKQIKDVLDAATEEQAGNQHAFHRVVILGLGENDNTAKTKLKNMGSALAPVQAQYDADIAAFPTMTEAELRAYTGR